MLKLGESLVLVTDGYPEDWNDGYMVTALIGGAYVLTKIPDGMKAEDLGRKFRAAPTDEDPTAAELL